MSINAQPFQPTFKLIGNLAEDQILTYDLSENAFVNTANAGGGGASGYTAVVNQGSGTGIYFGDAGTTLQLKTLIGGANVTLTDNGTGELIFAATNTDTIQDGTNLGTGTALFSSKDATTHALQFKSIVAGAGLTLTDDGAGTLTLVNDIAAGTTDADLTLSNLSNVVTARTNLGVYSKAEGDAKYLRTDGNFLPDTNNVYDIGSPTAKYNDIYAETFQGIAVLADQLTISGTTGQVLTHNGSVWVAGAGSSVLSSASDMSNVAPNDGQHLTWNATTNLWTPASQSAGSGAYEDSDARNAISVAGDLSYNSSTGVITFSQNDAWSNITGTPTTLAGYGITDGGGSVTASSTDTFTNKSGAISQWTNDSNYLTTVPAQTFASLTSKPTTLAGYGITDGGGSVTATSSTAFTNKTGNISQWTNDSGFVTTDTNTTYTAGSGLTLAGTVFSNTAPDQTVALTGAGATTISGTYPNFTITSTDTNTDTNTTYTAGSGLTLTGTAFSLTAGHFDGAYGSLTGAPTTVSSFTNDANYLSSVPAQAFSSLIDVASAGASEDNMVLYYDHGTSQFKWKATGAHFDGVFASLSSKPTTLAGYGITDATDTDTTYTAGSGLTLSGTEFSMTASHFDGAFSSLSGVAAVTASDDDKVLYYDHASTSFKWKAGGTPTGYNNTNWDTAFGWGDHASAGYLTSQTDSQTLSLSGTTLTISTGNNVDLGALTIDDFADVNITSVADNQFLKYNNGTGDWENETVTIPTLTSQLTNDAGFLTSTTAHYANADVDSHLNQSNPTSGYVLSWNGSDYAWIAAPTGAHFTQAEARSSISGTTGLSYNSTTGVMTLNASVNDLLDVSGTPTSGQVLKWTGSAWAPADDTDTNTDTVYTTFNTDFDTRIGTKSTTDLSEGTNKYFTDGRARAAISVAGSLSYNASTGEISYTSPTMYANSDVDTHLNSGSASSSEILSWNGSDYAWIANSGTPAWTAVTGKPTTFAPIIGTTASTALAGNTSLFDGAYASLSGKPTIPSGNQIIDWSSASAGTIHASNYTDTNTTYTAGSGITLSGGAFINASPDQTVALTGAGATTISGTYPNFTITSTDTNTDTIYANSDVDSHLNKTGSTGTGEILSWNGTDYSWITNSGGGGATDKIEEGNSSVEVIDGGANGHIMFNTNASDRWQVSNSGHILPETDDTYDIGSASKKVRDLYLGANSLYLDTNTIKTSGTNLLFNDNDVMDYANLKNKPDTISQGTGIQVSSGVVSLNSALSGLTDVATTAPNSGEVLKWNGSAWAPGTDLTSGSSAMNDLSDVDTTGISTGQYLKWDGSAFVASTVSSGGASAINDLSDVDTTTSAPSNGDVLTWVQADSEWAPATPAAGGGSGATIEMFKLNYATSGDLTSITNTTSGVSATITSATGGTVDITFSSTSYPPANMLMYGYAYASNKYVVKPVSGDMSTKEVTGGGSSGSPIAFGTMGSVKLTLKLREADTGASRSFGTTSHAWLMFTTI